VELVEKLSRSLFLIFSDWDQMVTEIAFKEALSQTYMRDYAELRAMQPLSSLLSLQLRVEA
jgi:hypothetical protein